jgi:chromosome segregation protein
VFPLDYDEIEVERTVHRDGQNEYKINGSKVRLKDVQELFAAANIGTTGHHIISQGEADRILTASPKDRREMIEDALGLKVFQYKKIDAERKLKKTETNIEKVQSLRKEVAPHIQFLERQIKKMERAVQLRKDLTASYLEYLRREDVYIAYHHDRLKGEQKQLQGVVSQLSEQLEAAKKIIEGHKKDAKSEELLSVEQKLKEVRNEKAELSRNRGQVEGQISYLERRINELKNVVHTENDTPIPVSEVKAMVSAIEKAADGVLQSFCRMLLVVQWYLTQKGRRKNSQN